MFCSKEKKKKSYIEICNKYLHELKKFLIWIVISNNLSDQTKLSIL